MAGAFWALAAGFGFGLFQAVNRRAVTGMDVYVATFLQLVVSAIVLLVASALTEDLGRVFTAPSAALVNFTAAGWLHFLVGWTLLNASQKRIGAARTSPLIGTVPLFATVIAAVGLREIPSRAALFGIVAVVAGVYVISTDGSTHADDADRAGGRGGWREGRWGLGAALCWATSPLFIRRGLMALDSPLLGVTVGMVASVLAYGVALAARRIRHHGAAITRDALIAKMTAGVLVGVSTWTRWVALALAPVGVVLAITLISVPMVILLSPLLVGRQLERVTRRIWIGAGCTVGGSLLLVLLRR